VSFGHGIEDVWDPIRQECMNGVSRYSWVETLGNLLQLDVVNQAVPGTSNKEISYRIQHFDFQQDDIALINWTFSERSCIIGLKDTNGPNHHISVHYTDPISTNWIEHHANYKNMTHESIMAICSADWVLEKQNIMRRHLFFKQFKWKSASHYISWLCPNYIPVKFDFRQGNRGFDNSHPDLKSYTEYAHQVHKWIRENEDINKWQ